MLGKRGGGFGNALIVLICIIVRLELLKDILLFCVSKHIPVKGDGRNTGGELLNSSEFAVVWVGVGGRRGKNG